MVRCFIDTEFTDFTNMGLISIGMYIDSSNKFYGEVLDYNMYHCSEFVKMYVIPQLGVDTSASYRYNDLGDAVLSFLSKYRDEGIEIVYDYSGDWRILCELLGGSLPWVSHRNISHLLDASVMDNWLLLSGLKEHHAMTDAIRNCIGYREPIGG